MAKPKKLPPVVVSLAADNEAVEAAKKLVLSRMSGCAEPNCGACRRNRSAVEELVTTVVSNVVVHAAETTTAP